MRTVIARTTLILLLLIPALAGSLPVSAIDREVRDRVVPAAVQLSVDTDWVEGEWRDFFPVPIGSGTIIDPDGLILTNAHVADPEAFAEAVAGWNRMIEQESPGADLDLRSQDIVVSVSDGVRPPQPMWRAEIVSRDESLDLAIIRIVEDIAGGPADGPFPYVPIGDSSTVGLGDTLHIFGYPSVGDGALTYTTGVVSGFSFESRRDSDPSWINTDAVMSGGSSGGTAVNDAGELIGIPTQGSSLDCRPGDTNNDGREDTQDVGCIPTGGSIGQLRPVNVALPLITRSDSSPTIITPTPTPRARATPPRTTPTPRPTSTTAPTADIGFINTFDWSNPDFDVSEPGLQAEVVDGMFRITVTEQGGVNHWGATVPPGIDFGWRQRLAGFSGGGDVSIGIVARDGAAEANWLFAVDPAARVWSLYRVGQNGTSYFVWVDPRPFVVTNPDGPFDIAAEFRDGKPTLLIGGTDVGRAAGVPLPEMDGITEVSLGVGIDPNGPSAWSTSFTAEIDEVELYPLP